MRVGKLAALLIVVAALMVLQASASEVSTWIGGTAQPMPHLNYYGPGPQVFGTDNVITWSSTNATNHGGSVFGFGNVNDYNNYYNFGGNGFWELEPPMAAVNDSHWGYGVVDTMTFAFATPVWSVGGFLNYVPPPESDTITTIAVYDSHSNLIESYGLTFTTGGGWNTGAWIGFLESSPDISYFTLTDNYIGITDLTTDFTEPIQTPEPSSLLLLGSGLAGILGTVRRKLAK
jgi:hypothetical protein